MLTSFHTIEIRLYGIVDDDADATVTFKAGIEDNNNNNDANKRIEVYTSNDPVMALLEFKPSFYDLLLVEVTVA